MLATNNQHSMPMLRTANSTLTSQQQADAAYLMFINKWITAEKKIEEQNNSGQIPYLVVLGSTIFLLSLVANVLVVISVFRSRRYRATAGLLALSLTVADLLITVVLLPLWLIQQNLSTNDSYLLSILVCKIHPALLTMAVGASAYTLVALSVDRLCIVRLNTSRASSSLASHLNETTSSRIRRVSLASWLSCCKAKHGKMVTVAIPWLIAVIVASPVLYFRTAQKPPVMDEFIKANNISKDLLAKIITDISPEASCREEWPHDFQLVYDKSLLVIHFAVPTIVQLCLYIYLGWIVSRLTSIPPARNSPKNESTTASILAQYTYTQQQPSASPAGVVSPPAAMARATSALQLNNGFAISTNNNASRPAVGSVSVVRRQRAWRTLIALSVLFPISWLPYYFLFTYLVNADPAAIGQRTRSLHALLELFAMLGFSNSAQNAIVYCVTDDRLRLSFKTILSNILCCHGWQSRRRRRNCNNLPQVQLQMNALLPRQGQGNGTRRKANNNPNQVRSGQGRERGANVSPNIDKEAHRQGERNMLQHQNTGNNRQHLLGEDDAHLRIDPVI